MVAKPVQTHIDLSVNRMALGGHSQDGSAQSQLGGEASKSGSVVDNGAAVANVTGLQSSSQNLSNKSHESLQSQSASFTESKV